MTTLLETLWEWTGWMCHQLPGRSPCDGLEVFPLCFRCAGLQLGLAAAYLSIHFSGAWREQFPSVRMVFWFALMMLPLMIDGAGNALHFWNSPGWWRGLTGLGVGLCLPWLLTPLARTEGSTMEAPPACKTRLIWPALGGVAAMIWLSMGGGPVSFRALAALAAFGWILFLGHFILALVRVYGLSVLRNWCAGFFKREVNA